MDAFSSSESYELQHSVFMIMASLFSYYTDEMLPEPYTLSTDDYISWLRLVLTFTLLTMK